MSAQANSFFAISLSDNLSPVAMVLHQFKLSPALVPDGIFSHCVVILLPPETVLLKQSFTESQNTESVNLLVIFLKILHDNNNFSIKQCRNVQNNCLC